MIRLVPQVKMFLTARFCFRACTFRSSSMPVSSSSWSTIIMICSAISSKSISAKSLTSTPVHEGSGRAREAAAMPWSRKTDVTSRLGILHR